MEITITIKLDEKELERFKSEKSEREVKIPSTYARFFDETSNDWDNDPEYNYMFLTTMQRWANDMLRSRGYLFLNEVYKTLGLVETQAGQIVGWVYDTNNPFIDNFVDFGLPKGSRKKVIKEFEKPILLDFNVDGVILDKVL